MYIRTARFLIEMWLRGIELYLVGFNLNISGFQD